MDITSKPQQNDSTLLGVIKNEKTVYPKAMKLIFNEKEVLQAEEQQQEYNQLNHFDQLYVTACRLYHDLNLPNHKYIAYQLALLYVSTLWAAYCNYSIKNIEPGFYQQCINRQGVPFISYKSRIESRFDEIKSKTKKSDTVYLDTDQIAW